MEFHNYGAPSEGLIPFANIFIIPDYKDNNDFYVFDELNFNATHSLDFGENGIHF